METIFSFNEVSVRLGENTILKDLSWQQNEGEHWVVLGPNGAGKTTFTKALMKRTPIASGQISVLGEPIDTYQTEELNTLVGYTSTALAQRLPKRQTVLDIVLSAAVGKTSRFREEYEQIDLERARDLMAAFSISDLENRLYGTLSHGEQQRVQVARAFMADPQALILDEPSSGLDLGARENLLLALTELAGDRRSPAMTLVTHHLEEIPAGFTHALILAEGKVTAVGPISETLTDENLSSAFGLPIEVGNIAGRWWARGKDLS